MFDTFTSVVQYLKFKLKAMDFPTDPKLVDEKMFKAIRRTVLTFTTKESLAAFFRPIESDEKELKNTIFWFNRALEANFAAHPGGFLFSTDEDRLYHDSLAKVVFIAKKILQNLTLGRIKYVLDDRSFSEKSRTYRNCMFKFDVGLASSYPEGYAVSFFGPPEPVIPPTVWQPCLIYRYKPETVAPGSH